MLPKRTLKVGDRGLATHVSHVLHSMLAIVQGRSVVGWELSPPHDADVVFVGQMEPAHHSGAAGQVMIAVSDGQAGQARSVAAFVLHYPFRVMQLLTLLDSIADHLTARAANDALHVPALWVPAMTFRDAVQSSVPSGLRVARTLDILICLAAQSATALLPTHQTAPESHFALRRCSG